MSFKNLQQRFEENVNKLYQGSQLKFDGGKPSTGANDDPLIVRRPGDGYWIRTEGRSVPLSSTAQDVKRLSLFTFSRRGILFLTKQQTLQTGNTFEQTRIINPAFIIGNAVPFRHIRRTLRPVNGQLFGFGKTDTSYSEVRKIGQLQSETYDNFKRIPSVGRILKKILPSPLVNTVTGFTARRNVGDKYGYGEGGWKKSRPELGDNRVLLPYVVSNYTMGSKAPSVTNLRSAIIRIAAQFITGQSNKFKYGGAVVPENDTFLGIKYGPLSTGPLWTGGYITYLKSGISRNVYTFASDYEISNNATADRGRGLGLPITRRQPNTRPLSDPTSEPIRANLLTNDTLDDVYKEKKVGGLVTFEQLEYQQETDKFFTDITKDTSDPITTQPFIKYFTPGAGAITTRSATNARGVAAGATKLSYIRDPLNTAPAAPGDILSFYKDDLATVQSNTTGKNDAITVSFAMGRDEHVQFRAFISGLQQTASPQYKTYQYIGRIEKFVSYSTVERQVSFKLGIIAFSKDELEIVWKRINYMTGLVFPYGFSKGILQPNIVRMTIGNIYKDQPCYITSLNTSFTELSETWDIDSEVPISAVLSISANLIEKDTKTANKPFYGITEVGTIGFPST